MKLYHLLAATTESKAKLHAMIGCVQASRQDQVQSVAQKALTFLAATQMLAAGL